MPSRSPASSVVGGDCSRPAVNVERDPLGEVALGNSPDDAGGLAGGLAEACDQRVDIGNRGRPGTGYRSDVRSLLKPPALTDQHAQALQLGREMIVELDDLVERLGDLPGRAGPNVWEPDREVPLANRAQHRE